MTIGAPFNPYRVFQGVYAPFWLIEHRGLSAGAKLCYVRLLGFAGRDGHCYPSLETLGDSLGVSDRQARGYIRELEKAGFIAVEQRGLRRTNVYLFLWTAELDGISSVTSEPFDPEPTGSVPPTDDGTAGSAPDRNNSSGQTRKRGTRAAAPADSATGSSTREAAATVIPDRKHSSALDRNDSSALDRKSTSGPIGINSGGIGSQESSSSSGVHDRLGKPEEDDDVSSRQPDGPPSNGTAAEILRWAHAEGIRRRRADGGFGLPDETSLQEWTEILNQFCPDAVIRSEWTKAVMNHAKFAADKASDWRNWSFLTLQVQLAAERTKCTSPSLPSDVREADPLPPEDPDCAWARVKERIRATIGDIPFANWFASSRQTSLQEGSIIVELQSLQTKEFIEMDYLDVIAQAAQGCGISQVEFSVRDLERG